MNQPLTASVCVLKYGNTFCSSIYPATESAVPSFDFKHGCYIGFFGHKCRSCSSNRSLKFLPAVFRNDCQFTGLSVTAKQVLSYSSEIRIKFPCHLVCTSLSCFFFVLCRLRVFFCGWFYGMTVSLAKLGKFADMVEICADLQMVVVDISASFSPLFAVAEHLMYFFSVRKQNCS